MRVRRRIVSCGVSVLLALVGLVAVGGVPEAAAAAPKCPLAALKQAKKPVEITMWHSMNRKLEDTLVALTDAFNSSQSAVKVKLVNDITYDDTFTAYKTNLATGNLPDVVQISASDQQQMIDTRTALPAGACAKADHYSFAGILPRVMSYFTVEGSVVGMPFNISGPVLYYNENAFQRAGLDPRKPPKTLDDVRSYAEKLKASNAVPGAPLGLKIDPGFFEHWRGMANKPLVNNDNGRTERATKAVFDDALGRKLFSWISGMVKDGLAETNPDSGANQYDNLLGIGNGNHAMAIETSASLSTIQQVLATGQYPDVKLGVGPMPSPGGKGGVLVQGAALYIVNKSSPAKQAAAWQFVKFLTSAASQVQWATGTGYIPIVKKAASSAAVKSFWVQNPGYAVAYEQLLAGVTSPSTAGTVIGPYKDVIDALRNAENSMVLEGKSPAAAVKAAAADATAAILDYNDRIGF